MGPEGQQTSESHQSECDTAEVRPLYEILYLFKDRDSWNRIFDRVTKKMV